MRLPLYVYRYKGKDSRVVRRKAVRVYAMEEGIDDIKKTGEVQFVSLNRMEKSFAVLLK